jgi:hypothetical protein
MYEAVHSIIVTVVLLLSTYCAASSILHPRLVKCCAEEGRLTGVAVTLISCCCCCCCQCPAQLQASCNDKWADVSPYKRPCDFDLLLLLSTSCAALSCATARFNAAQSKGALQASLRLRSAAAAVDILRCFQLCHCQVVHRRQPRHQLLIEGPHQCSLQSPLQHPGGSTCTVWQ